MPFIINKTLSTLLTFFPRPFIKKPAMRYVAGETLEEAIQEVKKLDDINFCTTLDILGEHSKNIEEAEEIKTTYLKLFNIIEEKRLHCSISLKLTHLGLGHNNTLAEKCLFEILEKAEEYNNSLTIDMENSPYTDDTIHLFKLCLERYSNVGIALQAYLHRSEEDLSLLVGKELNVRICKGIYHESPDIAFHDREAIRRNFILLAQTGLQGEAYVAIATHDHYLIDTLETWILNKGIQKNQYEFQVLYGIPMKGRLQSLQSAGHRVRIYVPFGNNWYFYAIRRLEENPQMGLYILKNLFTKK